MPSTTDFYADIAAIFIEQPVHLPMNPAKIHLSRRCEVNQIQDARLQRKQPGVRLTAWKLRIFAHEKKELKTN